MQRRWDDGRVDGAGRLSRIKECKGRRGNGEILPGAVEGKRGQGQGPEETETLGRARAEGDAAREAQLRRGGAITVQL